MIMIRIIIIIIIIIIIVWRRRSKVHSSLIFVLFLYCIA